MLWTGHSDIDGSDHVTSSRTGRASVSTFQIEVRVHKDTFFGSLCISFLASVCAICTVDAELKLIFFT